jgi:hypothetical protein
MNESDYNTYWLGHRLVTSISLSAEFAILSAGERRDIVPDVPEIYHLWPNRFFLTEEISPFPYTRFKPLS